MCHFVLESTRPDRGGDRGLPDVGLWQVRHALRDDGGGVRPADDRRPLNCHRHELTIVRENLFHAVAQLLMVRSLEAPFGICLFP